MTYLRLVMIFADLLAGLWLWTEAGCPVRSPHG